jgi:hypothetical protein
MGDQSVAKPIPPAQDGDTVAAVKERYIAERSKRLRADGDAQFVDLFNLEKFRHFKEDPWVKEDTPLPAPPQDGSRSEILIIGTGYAGLLYAARLIEAGFKIEDIRMVDCAGGFGGTWCE